MAQDFSWSSSANKYLDLYKKLIESSSALKSIEAYPSPVTVPSRKVREDKIKTVAGNGED
jgi:hypothetical protein